MNRFSVVPDQQAAFEQKFAQRESTLTSFEGFMGFLLLRRDGDDPDGVTHSTWSVWRSKVAFDEWKNSGKPPPTVDGAASKPPPSLYTQPPVPTFYEGILVLESAKGI